MSRIPAVVLATAGILLSAGTSDTSAKPAFCTPMTRVWDSPAPGHLAILALATDEWREFDLAELPFMGEYRAAGVDTVHVPPGILGDEPATITVRRRATPTRYLSQRFTTLATSAGDDIAPAAGLSTWVIPMDHDPSCRQWPRLSANWISPGDTVVFMRPLEAIHRTAEGTSIFTQWTAVGPYVSRGTESPRQVFERISSGGWGQPR